MSISESFINELEEEAKSTRRLLERVPLDRAGWKPHEKAFDLGSLAAHVAEIPSWTAWTLNSNELDFSKTKFEPEKPEKTKDLLDIFDRNVKSAKEALNNVVDDDFKKEWTMRNGDTVYFTMPKLAVLRTWAFNHWYHHRGQLSTYLRSLGVSVPGIYGPSADEQ